MHVFLPFHLNRPCLKWRGRFVLPIVFFLSLLLLFVDNAKGEICFREVHEEVGITYSHTAGLMEKKDYIFETKGGGLLLVDIDGDDIPELYFISASALDRLGKSDSPRNALYKRLPDGRYEECAKAAGVDDPAWGMGGCAADVDNDGDIDLYVTNFGPNRLYINDGKGQFKEEAEIRGVQCDAMSTGSSFGDADGDGYVDLYVCNYIDWSWETIPTGPQRFGAWRGMQVHAGPRGLPKAQDKLFHNRGDGTFEDWTAYSGLHKVAPQYGFQPVWFDADADGDQDIFVSNDSCPNYLLINDGDGRFTEEAMLRGVAYSNDGAEQGSMGVDLADINGDGIFDIVMTTWAQENNCLYVSQSPGFFEDRSFSAGFGADTTPFVGWGVTFLDFDNDGDSDLFFANGHVFPEADQPGIGTSFRQQDLLFENEGDGKFRNRTEAYGFLRYPSHISRGAVSGDVDGDGDLDIVVQNLNEPPSLWLNEGGSSAGHWLRVRCVASSHCNPIGSIIELQIGSTIQRRLISSGKSVFSQKELTVHFGLGQAEQAEGVIIRHANGKIMHEYHNIPANTLLTVRYGEIP
ncbi:MAG: CRTAC1 family protein [Candidatus Omnitrophota bacterium]|jgi:hypothetical protein|nr:MAG: CRTAC1 family protein [Candidatus Omnitrophota bacterium]